MTIRSAVILFFLLFSFTGNGECGGAVQKKKLKNTRPRVKVQLPKPRLHVAQNPVLEGKPNIHLNIQGQKPQASAVRAAPVEYQTRVLMSGKSGPGSSVAQKETADGGGEITDMPHLLNALRSSSRAWALIEENGDKQAVVQRFIDGFGNQGVTIKKSPAYYQNFIDQMTQRNPQMLDVPFDRLFQTVTVMEYDYDNGQEKDEIARQMLGTRLYEKNKKRLSAQSAAADTQP